MKKLLLISLTSVLLLSGCGVSQEDYDVKVKELNSAQEKLDKTEKELKKCKKDLDSAKDKADKFEKSYNNLFQDMLDEEKKYAESEKRSVGVKSWAETAFGNNVQIDSGNNYAYVTIPSGYTKEQNSLYNLMEKLVEGARLYYVAYQDSPDKFPYSTVVIRALNESTGDEMLSFQLSIDSAGNLNTPVTTINVSDYLDILPILTSYLNTLNN